MHRGLGFALDLGLGLWKRLNETPQGENYGMKIWDRRWDTSVHLSLKS